jgi:hypothetical protein
MMRNLSRAVGNARNKTPDKNALGWTKLCKLAKIGAD